MHETLEILPGEGEIKVIKQIRRRRTCDNCGAGAYYKLTFLLPNARTNPSSKAYGKDDCTWCEDEHQFSCKDANCLRKMRHMEGYDWCAQFPALEKFAHMFLYWEIVKPTDDKDG